MDRELTEEVCNSTDTVVGETVYDTNAQCCWRFAKRCPAVKGDLALCLDAATNSTTCEAAGCSFNGSTCFPKSFSFDRCVDSAEFNTNLKCCEDLRRRCDVVAAEIVQCGDRKSSQCQTVTIDNCELFGSKCRPISTLKAFCLRSGTSSLLHEDRLNQRCCGKYNLRCKEYCEDAKRNNDTQTLFFCLMKNATSETQTFIRNECESTAILSAPQNKLCCTVFQSRCEEKIKQEMQDLCAARDQQIAGVPLEDQEEYQKHLDIRCCDDFPGTNERCDKLEQTCAGDGLSYVQYTRCCQVIVLKTNKATGATKSCAMAQEIAYCRYLYNATQAQDGCPRGCRNFTYYERKDNRFYDTPCDVVGGTKSSVSLTFVRRVGLYDDSDIDDVRDYDRLSGAEVRLTEFKVGILVAALYSYEYPIYIELSDGQTTAFRHRHGDNYLDVSEQYNFTIYGLSLEVADDWSRYHLDLHYLTESRIADIISEVSGRNFTIESEYRTFKAEVLNGLIEPYTTTTTTTTTIPATPSMSPLVIAAIVGGSIVLVILVGALIFCLTRKKKEKEKKKKKEMEEEKAARRRSRRFSDMERQRDMEIRNMERQLESLSSCSERLPEEEDLGELFSRYFL